MLAANQCQLVAGRGRDWRRLIHRKHHHHACGVMRAPCVLQVTIALLRKAMVKSGAHKFLVRLLVQPAAAAIVCSG